MRSVLIIEDDHDVRVTLRQVFESAGYAVFTVTNGLSALELLKTIPSPRLILCDLRMPLMDGGSFIKQKSQHEKFRNVPVIVMSAHTDRFSEFPDAVCLSKPLDLHELFRYSEDAIGRQAV